MESVTIQRPEWRNPNLRHQRRPHPLPRHHLLVAPTPLGQIQVPNSRHVISSQSQVAPAMGILGGLVHGPVGVGDSDGFE